MKIKEWLEQLPEPYRTEALENIEILCDNDRGEHEKNDITSALVGMFQWSKSRQGRTYWYELRNEINSGKIKLIPKREMKAGDKVRCITAYVTWGNRVTRNGEIYTVEEIKSNGYMLLKELPGLHNAVQKDRFELITEAAEPIEEKKEKVKLKIRYRIPRLVEI